MKVWDGIGEEMGEGGDDPLPSLSTSVPVLLDDLSMEQKALMLYCRYGSLARVARELSVPIYELQKLSRGDWWKQEYANLQREEMAITNSTMTSILDTTLGALEERLAEGDIVVVNGMLRRVPVPAKDLVKIVNTIFDKRQLLRGLPTAIDSSEKKLEALAEKLRALGAKVPVVLDQEEEDGPEA